MKSFNLYKPVKKFYYTPDKVIISLLFLFLLPSLFEFWILKHGNDDLSLFSNMCICLLILVLAVAIPVSIINWYKPEPLKGTISGKIVFEIDKLTVAGVVYQLEAIEKISIQFSDYKGFRRTSRGFNGKLSNGVDNEVVVYTNGTKQIFYFQVEDKLGAEPIRDEFINYYLSGKLHFLNLIELLNITDYDEIQEFKNGLTSKH